MTTLGDLLLIGSMLLLWGIGLGLLAGRSRPGLALTYLLLTLLAFPALAQAPAIRGTLSSSGYDPPPGTVVTWVCPSSGSTRQFPLNESITWKNASDVEGMIGRYAGGDRSVQGPCFIQPIGSEQLGKDCWWAAWTLLGGKDPCPIGPRGEVDGRCQLVYDICVVNVVGHVATCCDYERMVGQKHPVAGERCQCGSQKPDPGSRVVPTPVGASLEGQVLSWTWTGRRGDVTTWTTFVRGAEGVVLGETRAIGSGLPVSLTMVLTHVPAGGEVVLRGTVRRLEPVEVVVRSAQPKPPPPPPPPPPPVDDLERRLEDLWRLLKPLLREWYRPSAASAGAIGISVLQERSEQR